MIYEMRTYTLKPGTAKQYMDHFRDFGLPILSRYATLIGYWYTDIGELNQLVHIWAYDSLDQRARNRATLSQDAEWKEKFLPKAAGMLDRQENKILLPADFSPLK